MKIPKKYQRILKDMVRKWDFLYLDSLTLALQWRKENKLQIPKSGPYILYHDKRDAKREAFVKYVYELVGKFYWRYYEKDRTDLGVQFAIWLLKTPVDFTLSIPSHVELLGL